MFHFQPTYLRRYNSICFFKCFCLVSKHAQTRWGWLPWRWWFFICCYRACFYEAQKLKLIAHCDDKAFASARLLAHSIPICIYICICICICICNCICICIDLGVADTLRRSLDLYRHKRNHQLTARESTPTLPKPCCISMYFSVFLWVYVYFDVFMCIIKVYCKVFQWITVQPRNNAL